MKAHYPLFVEESVDSLMSYIYLRGVSYMNMSRAIYLEDVYIAHGRGLYSRGKGLDVPATTVVIPHGIDGGAWWGSQRWACRSRFAWPSTSVSKRYGIGCSFLLLLQTGHELLAVGRLHPVKKPPFGIVHRGNGVFPSPMRLM